MATLLHNITQFYHYVNVDLADPRTKDFLFVSSPWPIAILLFSYHRFVRVWGPEFMKNRPPYDLKKFIILYNAVQIFASSYFVFRSLTELYMPGYYNIICQKIITDDTPIERMVVSTVWLYYMIKITDLIDTVIFVFRKKFTQASFLHVYHHIGMCLLGFIGTKYVPGGHGVMLGLINSGVHSVMYSYYLVSVVRPQWIRRWWKKYITQLQIAQFLFLFIHFGHVLLKPDCEYPKWVSVLFMPQITFMLILFTDFYLKEYVYKAENKNK